jgi:hypothetical protein
VDEILAPKVPTGPRLFRSILCLDVHLNAIDGDGGDFSGQVLYFAQTPLINGLGLRRARGPLKQAQLEMRERVRRGHGHDLPCYWGAFVLIGR